MARMSCFEDGLPWCGRPPDALPSEFAALIELGQRPDDEIVDGLYGCRQVMPPTLCVDLGLPAGSTYARAACLIRHWRQGLMSRSA
jgi:hypothetical protein